MIQSKMMCLGIIIMQEEASIKIGKIIIILLMDI